MFWSWYFTIFSLIGMTFGLGVAVIICEILTALIIAIFCEFLEIIKDKIRISRWEKWKKNI